MNARVITFEAARAKYVHRFTLEHVPSWAAMRRTDGFYYAPQYATDREWYDNTIFPGESLRGMRVHMRSTHCMTLNQSWPLGHQLRAPYAPGNTVATDWRDEAARVLAS